MKPTSQYLLAALALIASPAIAADSIPVYFGTYTRGSSEGIYQARFEPETGKLGSLELAAALENPSFLAFHPTRPLVCAVSEVNSFVDARAGGRNSGAVSSLKRDEETGKLTLLNQQATGGAHPCHVSFTPSGAFVMVANYSGGSVACFPIQQNGWLAPMSGFVQHEGSSVNERRQKGPHAHSINPGPTGRFFYAADLGVDKIFIYRLDAGRLVVNRPASADLAPGSGPRHFTFHPGGRFAYVINELLSTVTTFQHNADTGALTEIQTITTLPEDFDGKSTTAEVQVHPSGRFLYGSNRGHDSIAAFRINQDTGKLTPLGQTPSGGKTPRNFAIDPTGRYLIAAHQATDNVVVHKINQDTGTLEPTGQELKVSAPVCIKFAP
jgi:6-phosphogluconolactonase